MLINGRTFSLFRCMRMFIERTTRRGGGRFAFNSLMNLYFLSGSCKIFLEEISPDFY